MDMAKGRPIRTPEERAAAFFEKVNKVPGGCWLWTGTLDRKGYGNFNGGNRTLARAHRWLYQHVYGEVESGLDLDHLCRVRRCVNPEHLEPVTRKENLRRGARPSYERPRRDACMRGHAFTVENTYWSPGGKRSCRTCGAERALRKRRGQEFPPVERTRKVKTPPPELSAQERFDAKVRQGPNGCLLWTGGKTTGYGSFWDGERTVLAHRWAYERARGDVSPGMVLDHLCRNRACVNPEHIEEITTGENTRRGPGSITHCHRGHLLPERDGPGQRRCKECARISWEAWSKSSEGRAKLRAQDARREERRKVERAAAKKGSKYKTHCPAGHEYPTTSVPGKRRKCLPCEAERMRRIRAERKVNAA